jgi:branched-chain amino acid aminotransferase
MSLVWLNGKVTRDGSITLPADHRGLTLGDGLFETMLMVNGELPYVQLHMARMARSAAVLGLPYPEGMIGVALSDLGKAAGTKPHAVRVRLLRGETRTGLADDGGEPILLVTATPHDVSLIGRPCRLATVSIARNPKSVASTHKTLSYIDAIAAAREAEQVGADQALMLNAAGSVASSAIANLFLLKGETLVTPSTDQGILPGTTRQRLLQAAAALGLKPVERGVDRSELLVADAVFLTNALRLMSPVTEIDGRLTGSHDISFILDYLKPSALKEIAP